MLTSDVRLFVRLMVLLACGMGTCGIDREARGQEDEAAVGPRAGGSAVQEAVVNVLDIGWETSIAADQQIDQLYQQFADRDDWQLRYAVALTKMRQWKFDQALELATSLVRHPDAETSARYMRAWLLAVQKKYAAALLELESLAAALPSGDDLTDDQQLRRMETVERMGRIYGFLQGPAGNALTDFERESRKRRIMKHLSETEQERFEEQARRVAELYLNRIDEKDRVVEETMRKAEEDRERREAELADERTRIGEQFNQLDQQRADAQREYQDQLSQLQERDDPLRDRFAALDSEAVTVNRNLALVQADALRTEAELEYVENPITRDLLLQQLADLSRLALAYGRDLSRLDAAAAQVQRQRSELAVEKSRLDAELQGLIKQQRELQSDLQRQLRRIDAEEKRLRRERPSITGQARSMQNKAQALTTYLPFPFEEERKRLLDSLRHE